MRDRNRIARLKVNRRINIGHNDDHEDRRIRHKAGIALRDLFFLSDFARAGR
jgi:hypothetical protein